MLVKGEIIPLIIFLKCQSPKPRTTDRDSCKNKRDAYAVKDARIKAKERKTKKKIEEQMLKNIITDARKKGSL